MMRIDAPPNGKFWFAPKNDSAISGMSATTPRYRDPALVMRDSTYWRYSTVGRPARMPGTKPPYFFMLSATSSGLKVICT